MVDSHPRECRLSKPAPGCASIASALALLAVLGGCADPADWRQVGGLGRDVDLYGIWGTSAADIYAVGGGPDGAVVVHFDGDRWTRQAAPEESFELHDVWVSPSGELWVAGRGGLFQRSADGWDQVLDDDLEGIHGVDDNLIVAVGDIEIWRYDGVEWTRSNRARSTLASAGIVMIDVWVADSSFAVAAGGLVQCACQGNLLMHYTGEDWVPLPANAEVYLKGVWGAAPDDVYAVGGDLWEDRGSAILHFDGVQWSQVGQGNAELLSGIWGSGPTDIYAVGMHGDIQRYDGVQWRSSPSGTGANLRDVWGADPDHVWIVGTDGMILRNR